MKIGFFKRIIAAVANIAGFADTFRGRAEQIGAEIKQAVEELRVNVSKVAETLRAFRNDTIPDLVQLLKELRALVSDARNQLGTVGAQQGDVVQQIAKLRTDVSAHGRDLADVASKVGTAARGDAGAAA